MFLRRSLIATAMFSVVLGSTACAQVTSEDYSPSVGQSGKDVIWVPTPQALVDRMLDMAKLTPDDRLVDLGSGDGRTVITAAQRGAHARGIEYNPDMVAYARRQAAAAGVSNRARFEQADIFQSDFSDATIVTLFLLPSLNLQLRPTLLDMAPGTRIVSNSFDMGDWEPDETAEVTQDCTAYCRAMKWVVPARVEGRWTMDGTTLNLRQQYQKFEGLAGTLILRDGYLDGRQIRFSIGNDAYAGEVSGNIMQGTINGSRPWRATRG